MEISPEMDLETRIALDQYYNLPSFLEQSRDQLHAFRPRVWSKIKRLAKLNARKPHVEPPWVFAVFNFYDSALQLYYVEWFWRYYAKRIGLKYYFPPFRYEIFNNFRKPKMIKSIEWENRVRERERRVCKLYAMGFTTYQIANILNLSPSTVYKIIRRACRE